MDNGNENSASVRKIFLWAVPRSLSTAFYRAMESRTDTKAILEPFSLPYYYGEERVSNRYLDETPRLNQKFCDVTAMLENIEQDMEQSTSVVFVKDMAYYLFQSGHLPASLLPRGYQHTFLIRNPQKTVKSLYKMSIDEEFSGWREFQSQESGFVELWDLYRLLTNYNTGTEVTPKESHLKEDQLMTEDNLESPCKRPIIIDADDLLSNPEAYLMEYCRQCDIPFQASMLEWGNPEASSAYLSKEWRCWFEGVLSSSTFCKPLALASSSERSATSHAAEGRTKRSAFRQRSLSFRDLPKEVVNCTEASMPYYEALAAHKLIV